MTAPPPIRLPSGVRDYLPRAAARRRALADRVTGVFEAWGYARLITPIFEHSDVLERGLGAGSRAAAIRFVEPGTGEVVALRPDITPQVARVVATRMADVPPPIRLSYEGAVMRLAGEAGQREILQAGVELVGAPAPDGDAEVLAVAAAAMASLFEEYTLDVGHVAPAAFVLGAAPDDDARDQLAAALARKDRAGVRRAARALPADVAPLAEALLTWKSFEQAVAWPPAVRAALDELRAALAGLERLFPKRDRVTIDLADLRGFDYYTGVRFAAYAPGASAAVLRGGRYDKLLGRYGLDAPATGFAIDLEAVIAAHEAHDLAGPRAAIGVAVGEPTLASTLRAAGLRACVQTAAPADWPAWLRGAGLDAAVLGDRLVRADGRELAGARAAIEAARRGDTQPLIALLTSV